MIVDHELGLTILGRCGLPAARLVVENVRSFEWISLPRREHAGQGPTTRARALAAEAKRSEAEQQLPSLNSL